MITAAHPQPSSVVKTDACNGRSLGDAVDVTEPAFLTPDGSACERKGALPYIPEGSKLSDGGHQVRRL